MKRSVRLAPFGAGRCAILARMTHVTLVIVFGLFLLPALAFVFIPLFPTFWYLLALATLFGILDGFAHLTAGNLAVLAALFAFSILIDWSSGLLGARFGGAGWKSLLWGALGGVFGVLLMPPFGALLGLFVGVLAGELLRSKKSREALKAATGALVGTMAGMVLNTALALAFVILFFVFAAT